MRRLLAAAALATVLFAAGCGSDGNDASGDSGATPGPASTTAGANAAGGNTEQVCTDARKVVTDATAKFTQEIGKAYAAAASGNPAANDQSVQTIKTMFTDWAKGLRAQAEKATDGQLKTALADAATEVEKVSGSIRSATDLEQADKLLDSPALDAASKKIESICG
jgi:hypothetical protein